MTTSATTVLRDSRRIVVKVGSSLVTKLEPTLTTMRRASRNTVEVETWLMVLNVTRGSKTLQAASLIVAALLQSEGQCRPALVLEFAVL